MEADCLKIKSSWLRSTIGGFIKRILNKKLNMNIEAFCLNDLDVHSTANDDFLEVHLDINAVISKKDLKKLLGGLN